MSAQIYHFFAGPHDIIYTLDGEAAKSISRSSYQTVDRRRTEADSRFLSQRISVVFSFLCVYFSNILSASTEKFLFYEAKTL